MTSPRPEAGAVRGAASVLAWTLFVAAWLVLGERGRSTSALWFGGLAPVALWLGTAGIAGALTGPRGPSTLAVAIGALLAGAGLAGGERLGSGAGVCAAALGWGVLSCAAAKRVVALGGLAPGCALPVHASSSPVAWPALGARWAMLPMMAGLAVRSDWCAGLGLSVGQGVALHLAAMLLPLALLHGTRAPRLPQPALWIVIFMAAGVLALTLVPGVRGWMAMSLLHAVAWSIAWSQAPAGPSSVPVPKVARLGAAVLPAAALLALGALLDTSGPQGLIAVHVGLAALSLGGALAAQLVDAWHPLQSVQEERLS